MVFLSWKSRKKKKKSKFQVGQENFKSTSSTPTPFPVTGNAQIFLRIFNTPLLSKTFFHAQISKMPYAHNLFKIFTSKANKKLICPQNMISRKKKEKKRKEKKSFSSSFPYLFVRFLSKEVQTTKVQQTKIQTKKSNKLTIAADLTKVLVLSGIWRKIKVRHRHRGSKRTKIREPNAEEKRRES